MVHAVTQISKLHISLDAHDMATVCQKEFSEILLLLLTIIIIIIIQLKKITNPTVHHKSYCTRHGHSMSERIFWNTTTTTTTTTNNNNNYYYYYNTAKEDHKSYCTHVL